MAERSLIDSSSIPRLVGSFGQCDVSSPESSVAANRRPLASGKAFQAHPPHDPFSSHSEKNLSLHGSRFEIACVDYLIHTRSLNTSMAYPWWCCRKCSTLYSLELENFWHEPSPRRRFWGIAAGYWTSAV